MPPEFIRRASEVGGKAYPAWVEARENDDFAHFQPHLEQVVLLEQGKAELYGYEDEKYDPLLDKFEHGLKTAELRAIFNAVKEELIPLREAIAKRETAVSNSIVHQSFPIDKQKEFARYIADAAGYDLNRGHIGTVVHPFATSFSRDDARITTRWNPNFLNPSLYGTAGRCPGHGQGRLFAGYSLDGHRFWLFPHLCAGESVRGTIL